MWLLMSVSSSALFLENKSDTVVSFIYPECCTDSAQSQGSVNIRWKNERKTALTLRFYRGSEILKQPLPFTSPCPGDPKFFDLTLLLIPSPIDPCFSLQAYCYSICSFLPCCGPFPSSLQPCVQGELRWKTNVTYVFDFANRPFAGYAWNSDFLFFSICFLLSP